ncbi:MAG: AMP phosphorylase [Patescibacteria group bacterium]|nr:AMP phosphorylase [Patescibacteria group bacterium]
MSFFLKAKRFDFSTGDVPVAVLNEEDAKSFGIRPGDRIELKWKNKTAILNVDTTQKMVKSGVIGLFEEAVHLTKIRNGQVVYFEIFDPPTSIKAIKKKLKGQSLSYHETYSIIRDLIKGRISDQELAFYVASSFTHEMKNQELYNLTKAMVDTGKQLNFKGRLVADKHCVGGLPGNRTTMIIVPILASLDVDIPKTSSRAITSPAGTADTMEILAPVEFNLKQIKKIVNKYNGCIVWGGATFIAPADDIIVRLTKKISLEPLSKMIVSVMAKKVAMGIDYLLIDIPYGRTAKIKSLKQAKKVARKFKWLGRKFGIKIVFTILSAKEPIGNGIGPALEARDVIRVLQRKDKRPLDLENKALHLSGKLLELCGRAKKNKGETLAKNALKTGRAWRKMKEIIKAQGGNPNIDSEDITVGASRARIFAKKAGKITFVNNRAIDEVARSLGAPHDKLAGIRLHKKLNQKVEKKDKLMTLYGRNKARLTLGKKALKRVDIFSIK